MITKEVKLCGKPVTLAYCYATEISYKILSDQELTDFMAEAIEKLTNKQMPDIRKTIYLIIASMSSYYESQGDDAPVSDKDLLYNASPVETGNALGEIIVLRSSFYHVPTGEPEEKEPKGKRVSGKRKNV